MRPTHPHQMLSMAQRSPEYTKAADIGSIYQSTFRLLLSDLMLSMVQPKAADTS
jgi:hypothetical protein